MIVKIPSIRENVSIVESFIENAGDKVKIKEYAPKRKFFDFGNFISIAFDNIIDKVEEKVKMQKFGL